jgi:hypothetical protein
MVNTKNAPAEETTSEGLFSALFAVMYMYIILDILKYSISILNNAYIYDQYLMF